MDKYIVGNWKMNNDLSDIEGYVDYLNNNLENKNNVIACVPYTMIKTFADTAKSTIGTGAENCYFAEKGAYTGEISAKMLKSAGAEYVIIGHSERRQIFGETNEMISKKIAAVLQEGLKVIFCIGETLEQKDDFKAVLSKQIVEGLAEISDFSNIIVAYEPVWAIGTGKVATIDDIKAVHAYIKEELSSSFNVDLPILYGGSVKPDNSAEILALEDVGGVLVGGACLKAESFAEIAKSR